MAKERTEKEHTETLANVHAQSERVKDMVEDSAQDLTKVNTALKKEIAADSAAPAVAEAIKVNEAAEKKVDAAADELAVMTKALEGEVRERKLLLHQFAAATEQEQAARYAAFHDVLTGLPNRALFDDRLEHGLAQAVRHHWTLAVMFIDLDKFKAINDHHGHDAGDGVLKAVAQRLKENTRDDDTVSRYGGDEFLYLLIETGDTDTIALVADKLVKVIEAPIMVGAVDRPTTLSVAASIGIAVFPKDGNMGTELIRSADAAMYRAKHGKFGYAFAS